MIPFHIATPQGCNIQTFYGFGTNVGNSSQRTWSKPVGVSHVYIMLIGAGGNGIGTAGGASGAVTVWYGAAQHVPDLLYVVATGLSSQDGSQIYFDQSQVRVLLTAEGGVTTPGVATPAGPFAASGFYQSTAGQDGSITSVTASATTFLSGGADTAAETVTTNYGYVATGNGFFQMQPIIVGAGGSAAGAGGIGCGGGADSLGGPGFALIASW